MRPRFDPKDAARMSAFLTDQINEARERGDESISFDVGITVCGAGLESEASAVVVCDYLDSDNFAHKEGLWYHHRRGVWGTSNAHYTFLLGAGIKPAPHAGGSKGPSITGFVFLGLMALGVAVVFAVLLRILVT